MLSGNLESSFRTPERNSAGVRNSIKISSFSQRMEQAQIRSSFFICSQLVVAERIFEKSIEWDMILIFVKFLGNLNFKVYQ